MFHSKLDFQHGGIPWVLEHLQIVYVFQVVPGDLQLGCFSLEYSLKSHIQKIHEGAEHSKCDICGKVFSQKFTLKRHLEYVHEKTKNYICDLCGRAFSRKQHLKTHIKGVHKNMANEGLHNSEEINLIMNK